MNDGAILTFLAVLIAQNFGMWYRIGRVEQELRDIKYYVLKLNGEVYAEEKEI